MRILINASLMSNKIDQVFSIFLKLNIDTDGLPDDDGEHVACAVATTADDTNT